MCHFTYKPSRFFKLDIIYSIIYFPDTVGQVYVWFTNLHQVGFETCILTLKGGENFKPPKLLCCK